MKNDFLEVTELSGDYVAQEQVERLCNRYSWAGTYCAGKDVVELACGTGQGLGYLNSLSKSFIAGDISPPMVERAQSHYKSRIDIRQMDAQDTALPDSSCDVVILFEAIYYLPEVEKFIRECRRILRPAGHVLIATANKDLYDFNPSPHSFVYLGVVEMDTIFQSNGFRCEFFGGTPIGASTLRQRIFRPIKAMASRFHMIPNTMAAKKILKRFVFGRLVSMPPEMTMGLTTEETPETLSADTANTSHKVLYCAATKLEG